MAQRNPTPLGREDCHPNPTPLLKSSRKEEGSHPGNLSTTTQSDHIQEREDSGRERRDILLVIDISNRKGDVENKGGGEVKKKRTGTAKLLCDLAES